MTFNPTKIKVKVNKHNILRRIQLVIPWLIMLSLLVTAIAIFALAATGDPTRLGDPYYEDKILAPERAFIPWLLTMLNIALAVIYAFCNILAVKKRIPPRATTTTDNQTKSPPSSPKSDQL